MSDRELPRTFGGFVLDRLIAAGGMGEVFAARQQLGDGRERACVVKTILPELKGVKVATQRFVAEARTCALLSHKSLAAVLDVGTVDDTPYIAIERIQGRDLLAIHRRALRKERAFPEDVVRALFLELLDVLAYVHGARHPKTNVSLGVVHRDVSLHNLMLTNDGGVKLIDFGIARSAVNDQLTQAGQVIGKIRYMAPEQARGELVDDKADVFAASVVAAELASGKRFYVGIPVKKLIADVMSGKLPKPNLSRVNTSLRAAIEAGLSSSREKRPSAVTLRDMVQRSGRAATRVDVKRFVDELFPFVGDEPTASTTYIVEGGSVEGDPTNVHALRTTETASSFPMIGSELDRELDDELAAANDDDDELLQRELMLASPTIEVTTETSPTAPTQEIHALRTTSSLVTTRLTRRQNRARFSLAIAAITGMLAFVSAAVVYASSPIARSEPGTTSAPSPAPSEPSTTLTPSIAQSEAGMTSTPSIAQSEAGTTSPPSIAQSEAGTTSPPSIAQSEAGTTREVKREKSRPKSRAQRERKGTTSTAPSDDDDDDDDDREVERRSNDPPLFGDLVRALKKCTAKVACAAPTLARTREVASLSLDELRDLESDVAQCVAKCQR